MIREQKTENIGALQMREGKTITVITPQNPKVTTFQKVFSLFLLEQEIHVI